MNVECLLRLQQTEEAEKDPLLSGMVESLTLQMKRAVSVRTVRGLINQPSEAEVKAIKLNPAQVVVKGNKENKSKDGSDFDPKAEYEGDNATADNNELLNVGILTAGINSALSRLFEHHGVVLPSW